LTCLLFYLQYPHNALRFTNHVGEQRNFCKQKCDVPLLVCLSNSTLSAQRSAYFFKTLYGTTFPHTARLHKFMNNQTLSLRAGCRGRQPLHLVQTNSLCRKIATLFADFTLCYGIEKAVQSFVLRHRFVLITTLYFFFTFSAPLGRLTPIEALPQAPQGTLSLDPASPLTPGLCLRFISRFARC
jgi:hypothetical protein